MVLTGIVVVACPFVTSWCDKNPAHEESMRGAWQRVHIHRRIQQSPVCLTLVRPFCLNPKEGLSHIPVQA
jgi:hypothetical protein